MDTGDGLPEEDLNKAPEERLKKCTHKKGIKNPCIPYIRNARIITAFFSSFFFEAIIEIIALVRKKDVFSINKSHIPALGHITLHFGPPFLLCKRRYNFVFLISGSSFLFLTPSQFSGAGTAGTVSTGPDHACYTEQELQSIGGRCSKESHEQKFQVPIQNRYDKIGNEQYCADWMQFYGGIYFRFHAGSS